MDLIIRVQLHDIIFSNNKLFPLGLEKGWQKLSLKPIFLVGSMDYLIAIIKFVVVRPQGL